MSKYVLCWRSGGETSRFVYYIRHANTWCITYDASKATRFNSEEACRLKYINLHTFPETYQKYWNEGHAMAMKIEPGRAWGYADDQGDLIFY